MGENALEKIDEDLKDDEDYKNVKKEYMRVVIDMEKGVNESLQN